MNIKEKQLGSKMLFSPKGRVGLMFLKYYSYCLDKKTDRATLLEGRLGKEKRILPPQKNES